MKKELPPFLNRPLTLWARLYLWACHRLYQEFAWTYDWVSWIVSLGHWAEWRRQVLDYVEPGERILEIGFGTGELLIEMAQQGYTAWGLELSTPMHRITARKLRRRGLDLPRVQANAQAMPFADGAFDAILSTFPAEYIAAPETLREAHRLLRPGGRFIITGTFYRIDNPFLRTLLQLTFGSLDPQAQSRYLGMVEAFGFRASVIEQKHQTIKSSVTILEKIEE